MRDRRERPVMRADKEKLSFRPSGRIKSQKSPVSCPGVLAATVAKVARAARDDKSASSATKVSRAD